MELYATRETEQVENPPTTKDRRLLLSATLQLLSRRLRFGQPVLREDLLRAARLADDVEDAA